MSDAGFYLGNESFLDELEIDTKSREEISDRKYKFIVIAFIVLCCLLLGEFVIYKYIKPSLSSPKVTVSGQVTMTAEEIGMKLLSMNSRDWFSFDVEKAASILSSEPCISNVEVEKHFPDKIFVKVTERTPVAMTFVMDNGKSQPLQIDENGVLFTNKKKASVAQSGVPIISGIPIEHMTGGMRVPSKYKTLIDQITKIQNLPQKYFAAVSEICVVPKEYGNYELMLIPSTGHVKVFTDRALNEEALKYMMIVLDVVKQLESDVDVVDLRYGSVSYKSSELGV